MYVGNAIKVGFVGAVEPAISDHLCVLSQGNFLYVSTVLEDIHSERLSWADVADLQPGVSFLLSRHLSSKLASSPELGLAVEVLMAGSAEAGVPTSVIEEAVKTVLPDGALRSLARLVVARHQVGALSGGVGVDAARHVVRGLGRHVGVLRPGLALLCWLVLVLSEGGGVS